VREPNKINFSYTENYLNSKNTAIMPEHLLAFEENTILEPHKAGTPIAQVRQIRKRRFSLVIGTVIIRRTKYDIRPRRTFV
jgi:hypothetical protein